MSQFRVVGDGEVELGKFSTVAEGAQIVFAKPGRVTIGDYCAIGPGVKFVCSGGDVVIGDWTTLHDNCLVLSEHGVQVGPHCWFGQNCVIDGSGGLTIGSGVRVGMYSQIWSHVAAGEQIEGCTLYGQRPVVIEDDVWLVGSCIVASGVTLGERTVALIASNITKSWPAGSVLAGSPAALKPNLSFYRDIGLDEKWSLLAGWLDEASRELRLDIRTAGPQDLRLRASAADTGEVVFVKTVEQARSARAGDRTLTVCCVEDKSYNKQLTDTERRILKFLAGNKARFNVRPQAEANR
jgi:acetyltransferase-like isoleucine patch superfamily enzyme